MAPGLSSLLVLVSTLRGAVQLALGANDCEVDETIEGSAVLQRQSLQTQSVHVGNGEGGQNSDPPTGDQAGNHECILSAKTWTCAIPNSKIVCCDLVKAMMLCSETEACDCECQSCVSSTFDEQMPGLINAGFNISELMTNHSEDYFGSFCPAITALQHEDARGQLCEGTPPTSLLRAHPDRQGGGVEQGCYDGENSPGNRSAPGGRTGTGTCLLSAANWTCSVPGAKFVCCDLVKAMMLCGDCKSGDCECESCYKTSFENQLPALMRAGLDLTALMDDGEAYFESFCPAIQALKHEDSAAEFCHGTPPTSLLQAHPERNRDGLRRGCHDGDVPGKGDGKETCFLSAQNWTCAVPDAKRVCCDLAKAMILCHGCDRSACECDSCDREAFESQMPGLIEAGFNMTKMMNEGGGYFESFCPAMTAAHHERGQFCEGTPPASLLHAHPDSNRDELRQGCGDGENRSGTGTGSGDALGTGMCLLGGANWSCAVPDAKFVCCDLVKAMMLCGDCEITDFDCQSCYEKSYEDQLPGLIRAGLNVTAVMHDGEAYFARFCPAMMALKGEDAQGKVCNGTPPASLLQGHPGNNRDGLRRGAAFGKATTEGK